MVFKSQICTSKKQSGKLLALGLKKETADFGHCSYGGTYIVLKYPNIHNWDNDIPAWSLHRLIEMVADTPLQVGNQVGIHVEDTYDMVIQGIEWLISRGQFNKDYLEERL